MEKFGVSLLNYKATVEFGKDKLPKQVVGGDYAILYIGNVTYELYYDGSDWAVFTTDNNEFNNSYSLGRYHGQLELLRHCLVNKLILF